MTAFSESVVSVLSYTPLTSPSSCLLSRWIDKNISINLKVLRLYYSSNLYGLVISVICGEFMYSVSSSRMIDGLMLAVMVMLAVSLINVY